MAVNTHGNPLRGARYFLAGLRLILRPGVKRFVFVPLLVNAVLFSALIYFGASEFSGLMDRFLPGWLDWLRWLLWPVFVLAIALVVFFVFSVVGNLIAAPFNGFLAEAVERDLTGRALPTQSGWSYVAAEVRRSLVSELRKIAYFLPRALPILLLFLVPGLNLAAPFLWVAFGAWMLAIQYADYPMANHGLGFAEQRACLRERRLLALGFGGAAMFALVIPIVNFIVIPASVAGATAMWVEEFKTPRRPPV